MSLEQLAALSSSEDGAAGHSAAIAAPVDDTTSTDPSRAPAASQQPASMTGTSSDSHNHASAGIAAPATGTAECTGPNAVSVNPDATTTTTASDAPSAPAHTPATASATTQNQISTSSTATTELDNKSSIRKSNENIGAPVLAPKSDAIQRVEPTQRAAAPEVRQTAATTSSRRAQKPRKRGFLSSLFGCCVSSSAYDDEHESKNAARPSTTKTTTEPASNEKSPAGPATPTSTNVLAEKTNLDDSTPNEKVRDAGIRPADDDTPMDDNTAPVTSGPSPEGTPLPIEETGGVTAGAVMAPGKEASTPGQPTPAKTKRRRSGKAPESIITQVPEPGMAIVETDDESDESEDEDEEDEEQSLIARGGVGIPIGEDGLPHPLLDEISGDMKGRKCLVLDLDETLVHSSFKMVHQADYVVPVEIENQYHNVYVIKRPGVDAFLKAMGEIYEVVVFTASLSKYADPVLDQLDVHQVVKHRLFRESCYNNKGNYVKDLSQLGREMTDCIIIDNSPASYVFHVNNAVPISSWFNDPHDTELTDLVPFLTDLEQVPDVRSVLDAGLYQHLPVVE
ncbi:hypothetical protein ACM66B_004696 [Microbotryomycetes sp. NB124-2]